MDESEQEGGNRQPLNSGWVFYKEGTRLFFCKYDIVIQHGNYICGLSNDAKSFQGFDEVQVFGEKT